MHEKLLEEKEIKEKLFYAGIELIRVLGIQRTTVDKLTKKMWNCKRKLLFVLFIERRISYGFGYVCK